MTRPCFLVIEREYPGNISARKLVIETAKMNVITAYSSAEGIESLRRFPEINGVVLSSEVNDIPCHQAATRLKQLRPSAPLVLISPNGTENCDAADHRVSSHDPQELLDLLETLVERKAA